MINTTASLGINLTDLNGDGRDDIIVTTVANGPLIGLGNPSTTSITFTTAPVSGRGSFLSVTDITGDGKKDAIVGGAGYFNVLTGTGTGSFSTSATIAVTGTAQVAADFNGDGFLDVLATSGTNGTIRLGNGNGTFKAAGLSFNLSTPNLLYAAAGDFNGDGYYDIASLRDSQPTGQINYQTPGTVLTTNATPINITTVAGAKSALTRLDAQLGRIDAEIGLIGSGQSRLASAAQNLSTLRENYQIASANIKDADVATEVANLVRAQILQKAGAAVLAQANRAPEMLLSLLNDSGPAG